MLLVREVVRDDGDDGGDDRDRQVTDTTVDDDDPDGDGTSTTAADAATDGDPGPARDEALAEVALRLEDLPAGWSEASESTGIELCPEADPLAEVPPARAHDVAFTAGASGPFLASTVAEFSDVERAERFLQAVGDGIDACDRYERDGASYELERFTVRGLGEESVAARLTGETGAGDVGGPIYYVRVGERVVVAAALAIGDPADDDLARRAVSAVVERL